MLKPSQIFNTNSKDQKISISTVSNCLSNKNYVWKLIYSIFIMVHLHAYDCTPPPHSPPDYPTGYLDSNNFCTDLELGFHELPHDRVGGQL